MTSWVQSAAGPGYSRAGLGTTVWSGLKYWLRLRKAGTSVFGSISIDGMHWSGETTAATVGAGTDIGFGQFFRLYSDWRVLVGRFNVVNVS